MSLVVLGEHAKSLCGHLHVSKDSFPVFSKYV
jgi:hypothetical protein